MKTKLPSCNRQNNADPLDIEECDRNIRGAQKAIKKIEGEMGLPQPAIFKFYAQLKTWPNKR